MKTSLVAALAVAGAVAVGGCGKKGPPLTPIVRIPATVESVSARRAGADVYVTVTVPDENIDGSTPASVDRIELYAATAMLPPPRARFLEIATRIATLPVARAPDPETPNAPVADPDKNPGVLQGSMATLVDSLSAEDMKPRELPVEPQLRRGAPALTPVTPPPTALRRFYMAIAFSDRGRPGPPSTIVELPLTPLPERPTELRAAASSVDVAIQWEPAGGLIGWLLDRAVAAESPPLVELVPPATATAPLVTAELPAGPTLYNVYLQIAPDPLVLPERASAAATPEVAAAPAPVNAMPLAMLTYSEPVPLDERVRCYRVRSVRGAGAQTIESEPSDPACITPIDSYPPVTPTGLAAITTDGVINLIWEPNVEEDLGGYVILRREGSGDTLLPLTATPITDTRFADRTVKPGLRYTYQVQAVDSRIPVPNISDPAEVSETAR
jgi:hypothetical protein